jgi:hypothetical protein
VIVVELRRPTRNEDGYATGSRVVTRIRADGDHIDVEGEERDIDFEQRVLSLHDGRSITPRDGGEEWVRSLVATYRSPYLWAEIAEDGNPLDEIEMAPVEVEEPAPERDLVTA